MKKIKDHYDQHGYVMVRNLYSVDEIKKIKEIVDDEIRQYEIKKDSRDSHKSNGLVNSIHKIINSEKIEAVQKQTKLINLVEVLMGVRAKPFGTEIFVKPAKHGLKVPVHQDNYYWCVEPAMGLTVWVALEESGIENGGVYYFSGSHKDGLCVHERSGAPGSSQMLKDDRMLEKYRKVLPELKIGDALIHHALVLHGSDDNKSDKGRCGLTLRYVPIESVINQEAKLGYEINLNLQLNDRGEL